MFGCGGVLRGGEAAYKAPAKSTRHPRKTECRELIAALGRMDIFPINGFCIRSTPDRDTRKDRCSGISRNNPRMSAVDRQGLGAIKLRNKCGPKPKGASSPCPPGAGQPGGRSLRTRGRKKAGRAWPHPLWVFQKRRRYRPMALEAPAALTASSESGSGQTAGQVPMAF